MSNRPPIPYSVQLAMAQATHDEKAVGRIVQECFYGMTKEFLAVIHSYDVVDLPFVLATMQLTARAVTPMLGDSGRQVMENIMRHVSCVTVDVEELRRQARGNDNGGEEKR